MAEDLERARLAAALRKAAQGDRGALRAVYQASSAKLFGICLRILGDRQEAEDVLQSVYLTLWRRADGFEAVQIDPIARLVGLARHRAIDRLRNGRGETLEDPTATASLFDVEHMALANRLEALDPKHAAALRTAFFEGLDYASLARVAEVPIETMQGWIARGLATLREGEIAYIGAAECALGVLDGEARRQAFKQLEADPAFAAEVGEWHAALAPLAAEVVPVEPSPIVWSRVAAALGAPPGLWHNDLFWRGATIAGIAAAAASLMITFAHR